jgi:hypothetical protein
VLGDVAVDRSLHIDRRMEAAALEPAPGERREEGRDGVTQEPRMQGGRHFTRRRRDPDREASSSEPSHSMTEDPGQTRHSGRASTAVRLGADLPWTGLNRRVVTRRRHSDMAPCTRVRSPNGRIPPGRQFRLWHFGRSVQAVPSWSVARRQGCYRDTTPAVH